MAKKKRVRKPEEMSLAQLQDMVKTRASELSELKSQRTELKRDLADLERRISDTEGVAGKKAVAKKKVVGTKTPVATKKKKGAKKKVAKKKGSRPRNEMSAKAYAIEVLKKEPKGLTLNNLAKQVVASGFKTESDNFKMSLYQSIHKDRKANKTFNYSEKTGLWTLK